MAMSLLNMNVWFCGHLHEAGQAYLGNSFTPQQWDAHPPE